jgi:hypothetical protein
MCLVRVRCVSSDIAYSKGNIRSCLITSKVERSDLRLVLCAEVRMGNRVVLHREFDMFIKRCFDLRSVIETIFSHNLVDIFLLVNSYFSRFLFHMHA